MKSMMPSTVYTHYILPQTRQENPTQMEIHVHVHVHAVLLCLVCLFDLACFFL